MSVAETKQGAMGDILQTSFLALVFGASSVSCAVECGDRGVTVFSCFDIFVLAGVHPSPFSLFLSQYAYTTPMASNY